MRYHIFLDDERQPNLSAFPAGEELCIIRSYQSFKDTITERGLPASIAFDHDLGYDMHTGLDCLKWLISYFIDADAHTVSEWPDIFCHSQNPVGRKNILSMANNFFNSLNKG